MFDSILSAMGLMRFRTIEVDLDTSANPKVVLERIVNVRNRRVRWTRANSSFEFKAMTDLDTGEFPSIHVDAHQITCRNKNKLSDISEYTITVEDSNGDSYNTTVTIPGENGNGDGDKPVIRN